MNELNIQSLGQPGTIILKITYPVVSNLTYNFKLTIRVFKQQVNGQNSSILTTIVHIPEKQIRMYPLQGGQIYKTQAICNCNGIQFKKTVFTYVSKIDQPKGDQEQQQNIVQYEPVQNATRKKAKQPKNNVKYNYQQSAFSRSEDLMKMIGKSVGIKNQKQLQKYILQGRNCRNTKQFLNLKADRVNGNIGKVLQKQQMLIKSKIVLNDIYKQRQGMQFLKNDWFMGPFYSYNQNEKQLARQ